MARSTGRSPAKVTLKKSESFSPPTYNPFDRKYEIKKNSEIIFSSEDKEKAFEEWERLKKESRQKG